MGSLQWDHVVALRAELPWLEVDFLEQPHDLRTHVFTEGEVRDVHLADSEDIALWKQLHEVADVGFVALESSPQNVGV